MDDSKLSATSVTVETARVVTSAAAVPAPPARETAQETQQQQQQQQQQQRRRRQEPNDDSNVEKRRRQRPWTTAAAAAAAAERVAAASRGEVEQQGEPQEDEEDWTTYAGGSGGVFTQSSLWADSDLEWRGAPPAGSDAVYELNMQLAAYAKDAQWEMAIMLLRQARTLWKDSSRNDSGVGEGGDGAAGRALPYTLDEEGADEDDEEEDDDEEDDEGVNGREAEGEDSNLGGSPPSVAEEWAAAVPAVEPNVVSYNNVITACANARKQKRAEGIFREMTKKGVRPNVFTYGALISACAKRGNWEDSVNYLEVCVCVCVWSCLPVR